MKKMFFALVAMVMMTMSANAQSNDNNKLTFDRMANYLELRIDQVEPVRTALAQFDKMLATINQLQDVSMAGEAWEKIQTRHKKTMKKILNEKQYKKYTQILDLTAKNTAERLMDEATAAK